MIPAAPDLDDLKTRGDAPADAVIEKIQARCGEMVVFHLMSDMMKWHPGTDPERLDPDLIAFIEQAYERPAWFSEARVRLAQKNYQKNKNPTRVVLGAYSLPALYLDPDIALTLIGTGQLSTHVRRRLGHTQDFVDAVMAPGALDGPGVGWRWIRKVRLTHAIRRALAKLPQDRGHNGTSDSVRGFFGGQVRDDPLAVLHAKVDWRQRHDDEPIDQLELAYVMLTFSWVVVDGVSRLGPRYGMTRPAREAHIHTWAVVGNMLGIVDQLLPGIEPRGSDAHAKLLFETLRERHLEKGDPLPAPNTEPPPGIEEGRQLMAALLVVLVDVTRENIPDAFRTWVQNSRWLDNVLQDLPRMLIYKLAGTPTARMLHVTPPPLLHWIICRIVTLVVDLRTWETTRRTPAGA